LGGCGSRRSARRGQCSRIGALLDRALHLPEDQGGPVGGGAGSERSASSMRHCPGGIGAANRQLGSAGGVERAGSCSCASRPRPRFPTALVGRRRGGYGHSRLRRERRRTASLSGLRGSSCRARSCTAPGLVGGRRETQRVWSRTGVQPRTRTLAAGSPTLGGQFSWLRVLGPGRDLIGVGIWGDKYRGAAPKIGRGGPCGKVTEGGGLARQGPFKPASGGGRREA